MSIQPFQLIFVMIFVVSIFALFKIKSTNARVAILVSLIVLVFLNPFRFKQENGSVIERSINRFDEVPQKIEVKQESFNEFNQRELDLLKQQSEERKHEIHN